MTTDRLDIGNTMWRFPPRAVSHTGNYNSAIHRCGTLSKVAIIPAEYRIW